MRTVTYGEKVVTPELGVVIFVGRAGPWGGADFFRGGIRGWGQNFSGAEVGRGLSGVPRISPSS